MCPIKIYQLSLKVNVKTKNIFKESRNVNRKCLARGLAIVSR